MKQEAKQRLANGIRDRAYKADPVRHAPAYHFPLMRWLLLLVALFCLYSLFKTI